MFKSNSRAHPVHPNPPPRILLHFQRHPMIACEIEEKATRDDVDISETLSGDAWHDVLSQSFFACEIFELRDFCWWKSNLFLCLMGSGGMRKMRKAFVTIHHQFDLSISVESSDVRGLKFRMSEWKKEEMTSDLIKEAPHLPGRPGSFRIDDVVGRPGREENFY